MRMQGITLVTIGVLLLTIHAKAKSTSQYGAKDNKPKSGSLAVMGGYSLGDGPQRTVYGFDVYDGLVVRTANGYSMPNWAWYTGHTQRGNELYVVGGEHVNNNGVQSDSMKYHYGLWSYLPTLPMARKRPCTFIIRDVLYAAGGIRDPQHMFNIQAMDLNAAELKWEPAPIDLPFSMWDERCATIGDHVYITVASYLLQWGPDMGIWSALMTPPESRQGHCMVSDDVDRLWVIGGEQSVSVMMYNTTAYRWTIKTPIPVKSSLLTGHSCVFFDGWIYVVGGIVGPGDGYQTDIYAYDVENDQWKTYLEVLPEWGLTEMATGILQWEGLKKEDFHL